MAFKKQWEQGGHVTNPCDISNGITQGPEEEPAMYSLAFSHITADDFAASPALAVNKNSPEVSGLTQL